MRGLVIGTLFKLGDPASKLGQPKTELGLPLHPRQRAEKMKTF